MRRLLPLGLVVVVLLGCADDKTSPSKSASPLPATNKSEAALGVNPRSASQGGDAKSDADAKGITASATGGDKDIARKIVFNATVALAVQNFDPVPDQVNALAKRFGAYVARSQIIGSAGSPRSGHWTLRVPSERFEEFLVSARQVGDVQNLNSDSQDVTDEYYDIDARIRNKKQEETRLLDLLAKAAGRLDEVLNLERELTRVRGEVEQFEGRLRVLGSLSALGTVVLDVKEIKNYVPEKEINYVTRVRRTWDESLSSLTVMMQSLSIAIVAAAPWAAIILPPSLLIALIVRRAQRKRR
jgi:hypothetical protein